MPPHANHGRCSIVALKHPLEFATLRPRRRYDFTHLADGRRSPKKISLLLCLVVMIPGPLSTHYPMPLSLLIKMRSRVPALRALTERNVLSLPYCHTPLYKYVHQLERFEQILLGIPTHKADKEKKGDSTKSK